MASIANILLNDGLATPVSHTFAPVEINSAGIAKWADRSGGISLGYPVVTLSVRQPSKGNRAVKVIGKVVIPTLDTTSPSTSTGIQPAPSKAYDLLGTFEFVINERSNLAQKKDLLAFVRNLLAHAVITSAVETNESVY